MDMRNIAETMLDDGSAYLASRSSKLNLAETMLDDGCNDSSERVILNPGQTIASDYVVVDRLGTGGAQATVYVARRAGKQCAIKIYNRGYKPSEDFVKALKGHSCPYVANLLDYGYQGESYYEVYEYYGNGTLEDKGKCSITFIKDVVIPNVNEGLRFLHTLAGKGIIHGDIKPSNIFISNDETHVLIGDFGISSYLDKSGKLIGDMKGTPEYAPRTRSFFGKATRSPAYDYCSLGLVLIKLATGHSIFEGLDLSSITRKWEEGIKVPESINSRIRQLIEGLIVEDEKNRFGYDEVVKWCEGEYVRVIDNSLYSEDDFDTPNEPDPLIFGIFGDRIVTVGNLRELATAISDNWDHAKRQIKRAPFNEFLVQFDTELAEDVRGYSKLSNADHAVFYALYRIFKSQKLVYKGKNYGTAVEFVNSLAEGCDPEAQDIIKSGLFEFFLKCNDCDADLLQQVNQIVRMDNKNPEFVPQMLYYLFNKTKEFKLNGKVLRTPDDLIDEILKMRIDEIDALTGDSKLMAWLYSIGYHEDVLRFFET